MKKSSGSPTRTYIRESDAPVRPVPSRTGKDSRGWRGYLAAGGAVIILILLILPCQVRRCGGAHDHGTYAYRWILPGVPSGTVEKETARSVKGPDHRDRTMLRTLKRTAPHRGTGPVDKQGLKDTRHTGDRGAVKPPNGHEELGTIETGERGAVKPKDRTDQGKKKSPDEKGSARPVNRPPDFGTKLELVPAPGTR